MSIRREDKELIHNLGVMGALLGACLGVFVVVHLSARAHEQNRELSKYQQTHAALAKLTSPKGVPGELVVDQTIIKQVQEQIQFEQPEVIDTQVSFWLRIPRWGFWIICGASCIGGAIAGFSTVWLTGWTGSISIYYFIRFLYMLIRKVAPNSSTVKSLSRNQAQTSGHITIQRDDNRILPIVVKLVFLLILVLSVLGAVVWHLVGI